MGIVTPDKDVAYCGGDIVLTGKGIREAVQRLSAEDYPTTGGEGILIGRVDRATTRPGSAGPDQAKMADVVGGDEGADVEVHFLHSGLSIKMKTAESDIIAHFDAKSLASERLGFAPGELPTAAASDRDAASA